MAVAQAGIRTRLTSDHGHAMTTIGITGHRGLSPQLEAYARAEIRRVLHGHDPAGLVGVSCVADGPDSSFAAELLDHGGRLIVVIPASDYRDALPSKHRALYDQLLAQASEITTLPCEATQDAAFLAAGRHLVDASDELLAVWDGQPARGPGGTADVVAHAQATGIPVTIIWPTGASRP